MWNIQITERESGKTYWATNTGITFDQGKALIWDDLTDAKVTALAYQAGVKNKRYKVVPWPEAYVLTWVSSGIQWYVGKLGSVSDVQRAKTFTRYEALGQVQMMNRDNDYTKSIVPLSLAAQFQEHFEKSAAKAENKYHRHYDNPLYAKAVEGLDNADSNKLIDDAMAICGHPGYKYSKRGWNADQMAFLARFMR